MSNETKIVPVELTKREQWLICQAFRQGYGTGHNDSVESAYNGVCEHEDDGALDWLNDYAADGGVTVADVLCKAAPAPDDEPNILEEILKDTPFTMRKAPDDELARLEHTLSEWFCDEILENMQLRGLLTSTEKWSDISEYVSGMRAKFLQWMELTGRIERHPDNPNLVRLRDKE